MRTADVFPVVACLFPLSGGPGRVVLRVVIHNWSAVMGCENKMATWTGEREKKLVLFTWKRTDIGCKMGISVNE